MPNNINIGNIHINKLLTDYAIGYRPKQFVAEQVFSPTRVKFQSDDYAVWTQADAFRIARSDGFGYVVADGASALEDNASLSFAQYKARAHKLKTRISDQQKANADPVITLEQIKTNQIQDKLMLAQEVRVANVVRTVANYPSGNTVTNAGVTQWNNAGFVSQPANQHSAIIAQLLTARDAVRQATGGNAIPTHVLIPPAAAIVMANDPGLIDLLKYTNGNLLTDPTPLGKVLGMTPIIPGAMANTNIEGAASQTLSDIWGKDVILFYHNPSPGTYGLTFGSIFRQRDWLVRSWRDEDAESTIYEASQIQDERLVAGAAGYLIKNAVA